MPGQDLQIHSGPMAGQLVLATGGTGDIGEAIALGAAAMGARLAATGRDRGRPPGPAVEIRAADGQVEVFVADLSRSLQHWGMCERPPRSGRTDAGAGFAGRPSAAPVGCAAAAAAAYRAQRADLAGGRARGGRRGDCGVRRWPEPLGGRRHGGRRPITRRVAGLTVPGFAAVARVIAEAGAAPAAVIAGYLLLLALIVFRRFRHLLVLVVSYEVLALLTTVFLLAVHRPLPFRVLVQFRWAGFSMPSVEVEKVCAVLTGALYTLAPAGRWRRRGGWAAAVIVAVIGLSRMRLGVDAPTDVLLGAILSVTVPLLGLRLFAPQESFPVVYGGAHGAHLSLGGARGEAIKRALKDQMDVEVSGVEPFGLAGSGGSSPMRLRRAGQPG